MFDETWMSMLGLMVGCTPCCSITPVASQRVRMSLLLEPTTSWLTGVPVVRATHPANTLPKLPVGTENETGDVTEASRVRAAVA